MTNHDQALSRLLGQVEDKAGRKMKTPKDFDFLVEQIYERTHTRISVSTLKRLWGYVDSYPSVRESTLDLLAQFVGYENYRQFCITKSPEQGNNGPTQSPNSTLSPPPPEQQEKHGHSEFRLQAKKKAIVLSALLVSALLLSVVLWKWGSTGHSARGYWKSERPVLKKGQTFASYEEFLTLFNINATDDRHYQPIPECSIAYVWAPQYHHPTYHNDGNPDSLMPTIAEYLSPKPSDSPETRRLIIEEQKRRYYSFIPTNQVRVVFMKNLPGDTCFTFTGIYRVAYHLSDTTKVVWIRSSSECDLNHLENLPLLRN